jgi:hypothetical protein
LDGKIRNQVTKKKITEFVNIYTICEKMGWTLDDYNSNPAFFLENIFNYEGAKSIIDSSKKNG